MIINIRGTSGAGKTYAARAVMAQAIVDVRGLSSSSAASVRQIMPVVDAAGEIKAHVCHFNLVPLYVLGNYDGPVCGGCDTVKTQDEVCSLVRHFSQFGHVIFEGVVIGTIFDRYLRLDQEMTELGMPYIWAYLDTSLDVCLTRVQERRDARGDSRPFNPASTEKKYEAIWRTYDKALEAGRDVRLLPHDGLVGDVLMDWLAEDNVYEFQNSWRKM